MPSTLAQQSPDSQVERPPGNDAHKDASFGAPAVCVISGVAPIRRALEGVIRAKGWRVNTYGTAAEFLARHPSDTPSCLILDATLPDVCGLELQQRLNKSEVGLAVVFVLEQPDVSAAVRAIRAGAVEVIAIPIPDSVLLGAIDKATKHSQNVRAEHSRIAAVRRDYASLTMREKEVMSLVVSGLLNKQAAHRLGISTCTVKAHRARAMRKMRALTFVDLVRKAADLSQATN